MCTIMYMDPVIRPQAVIFFFFTISLFLAVLGLHCCFEALSSSSESELLSVEVHGLPVVVASLVWTTGSRGLA